ncbi:hypothetical protein GQ44DRAFT_703475 [Phaeosphaeriaceae sp. PMI808]|nr:hypothetical protein GQ44DRAFT_703475 [Phaeosphaeriaceae sp. PMI808]
MTSVMSSAAPSASSSSCSTADFTKFPVQDVACAVASIQGLPSNTTDALKKCCKSKVEDFNAPCGYLCLASGQSVADLQKCFMDGGVSPGTIFCNGNNTATATAKPSTGPSSTSGASSGASSVKPSGTGSSGASQSTVPGFAAKQGVSKAGLGMLGMIVVSAFAGAML